jgi:hypothetical protein
MKAAAAIVYARLESTATLYAPLRVLPARADDARSLGGHTRGMTTAEVLPIRREVLLDERGDRLQATWHPRERLVVLSEWRGGMCRATFHLTPGDAARLATFLVGSLGDAATSPPATQSHRTRLLDRLRERLRLDRG